MLAFRSAIRKLFGISIPGVDNVDLDAAVIKDLRASLEETEAELQEEQAERSLDNLLNAVTQGSQKQAMIAVIATLMLELGVDRVSLVDEDDEDDFPNEVVDSY